MVKRLVAAPLWFLSMWWGYNLAAFFLGFSADAGVIVGAVAAAFVIIDPTGFFWGPKSGASSSAPAAEGLGATASSR